MAFVHLWVLRTAERNPHIENDIYSSVAVCQKFTKAATEVMTSFLKEASCLVVTGVNNVFTYFVMKRAHFNEKPNSANANRG